jgi:ribosome biogenesis protein BMS1
VTGVVIELNTQFKVMKKLKLIGEPYKIMKNTAFIKGMFNSSLEVAKFTGASIKTVSGIRGAIKKAVKDGAPDGAYRATFEDKILKSDIVFCRTWYQVEIPKFCNPIVAYGRTRLIKTHAELRRERGIQLSTKKDSEYLWHDEHVDRERDERVHAPLQVPKAISQNLPFKSKEKVKVLNDINKVERQRKTNLLEALNLPTKRPFKKMFMTEDDKQIYSMVQRLGQLDKQYAKDKKVKDTKRTEEKRKREQKVQEKRDARSKENRVNRYKRAQGGNNQGGHKHGGKKD